MKLEYMNEMGYSQARIIEKKLDTLFADIGVDVDFTEHFKKRVTERNIKEEELVNTFTKLYDKYRNKIKSDDFKGLIYDVASYLNIPIEIKFSKSKDEYDLIAITVIRNKKQRPTDGTVFRV